MLNSLIIAQQQQSQQQQQVAAAAGTLEQLIRAAKLMEQRAVANNLLLAASGGTIGNGTVPSSAPTSAFSIAKFGEDYQERMLASKIRAGAAFADPNGLVSSTTTYAAPNSTGSSRRSSPISAASSAPHSPDSTNSHLLALANPSVGMLPTTSTTVVPHHQQQSTATIVRASSSASSSAHSTSGGGEGGRRVSGSRQSRAAHNELEKNRRANLRGHLEALKSVLPPESDSHRDTTLSLLTRARNHIRFIKEQKCDLAEKRAALLAEHLRLREMLQNGGIGVKIQMESTNNEESNEIEANEELPAPKPMFVNSNILASTTAAAMNAKIEEENEANEQMEESATKPLDLNFLALNGLLPALPLLYPYNSMQAMASALAASSAKTTPPSSNLSAMGGEFC